MSSVYHAVSTGWRRLGLGLELGLSSPLQPRVSEHCFGSSVGLSLSSSETKGQTRARTRARAGDVNLVNRDSIVVVVVVVGVQGTWGWGWDD